jgi:hypothetical protein
MIVRFSTVVAATYLMMAVASGGMPAYGAERVTATDVKVRDNKLGLDWAASADTPSFKVCRGGKKSWPEAVTYVECLNANNYLGHDDWRLPSPDELRALAKIPSNVTEHKVGMQRLKDHGFKNVQPSLYWSSVAVSGEVALAVDIYSKGAKRAMGKGSLFQVLPVRGSKEEKIKSGTGD